MFLLSARATPTSRRALRSFGTPDRVRAGSDISVPPPGRWGGRAGQPGYHVLRASQKGGRPAEGLWRRRRGRDLPETEIGPEVGEKDRTGTDGTETLGQDGPGKTEHLQKARSGIGKKTQWPSKYRNFDKKPPENTMCTVKPFSDCMSDKWALGNWKIKKLFWDIFNFTSCY